MQEMVMDNLLRVLKDNMAIRGNLLLCDDLEMSALHKFFLDNAELAKDVEKGD